MPVTEGRSAAPSLVVMLIVVVFFEVMSSTYDVRRVQFLRHQNDNRNDYVLL